MCSSYYGVCGLLVKAGIDKIGDLRISCQKLAAKIDGRASDPKTWSRRSLMHHVQRHEDRKAFGIIECYCNNKD